MIIILQFFCSNALADKFHGRYVDWSVFSNIQGDKNICYMISIPLSRMSNAQNRGEPHFMITKVKDKLPEINIASGYYYKKNSQVELSFGLRKFTMLTYKSQAWSYELDDDIEIIKTMKNSDTVIVKSVSDRNHSSEDTYSLVGFLKAYEKLMSDCKQNSQNSDLSED